MSGVHVPEGWALVLGGGGAVGAAYCAGALAALAEHGVDIPSADLMVGTSAGSLVAAQLRLGVPISDLAAFAAPTADVAPQHLAKAWRNRADLARRAMSSSAVAAGTMLKVPMINPPPALRRAFPGGMFQVSENDLFANLLPHEWPPGELWVVAVDLRTRKRKAFGKAPVDRERSLRKAVRASCAVPGVFEPVRIDKHNFVDGGARTSTSLDMALYHGVRRAIVIAPMAYDKKDKLAPAHRALRVHAMRMLKKEMQLVRPGVQDVLVIHPSGPEIALHGNNLLRPLRSDLITEHAHETVSREIKDGLGAGFFEQLQD